MVQRWSRFELLDLASGSPVGWLPGVSSCTLDWSLYASTHGAGRLSVTGEAQDWPHLMVRPWLYERVGGAMSAQPRGVYLLTSPGRGLSGGTMTTGGARAVEHDLSLYSQEARLSRVPLRQSLDIPTGTNFVSWMVARLQALGVRDIAATPSSKTVQAPIHFDAGTSELEVWNHLAESIGYWGLRFSASGQALVQPYVAPGARPDSFRFAPGADKFRPSVAETSDDWKIPNVLVGVSRMEDGSSIPYAAENLSRGPYSYEARGYWVGDDGGAVQLDCPDIESLAAAMERRLVLASVPARSWDAEVARLPLEGGEVGRLEYVDVSARVTLTKRAEDLCDLARDMRVTLEEVAE